jgi:hypothetical protein
MNITILIKLLEAHARKPVLQAKKETNHPMVLKPNDKSGHPLSGSLNQPSIGAVNTKGIALSRSLPPGKVWGWGVGVQVVCNAFV